MGGCDARANVREMSGLRKAVAWCDYNVGQIPAEDLNMNKKMATNLAVLAIGAAGLLGVGAFAQSPSLPASTALPVRFEHSVDAKKSKVGDVVKAKTMQVVVLPSGASIAKGSLVLGHITAVEAYRFDTAPYAHQKASLISVHFDKIEQKGAETPVSLSV